MIFADNHHGFLMVGSLGTSTWWRVALVVAIRRAMPDDPEDYEDVLNAAIDLGRVLDRASSI